MSVLTHDRRYIIPAKAPAKVAAIAPAPAPAKPTAPAPTKVTAIAPAKPTAPATVSTAGGHTRTTKPEPPPWSTRRRLAYALLTLLAVIVLAALAAMFLKSLDLQRIKDVMTLVLGPVAGLVGAAVGFYFGAKTGSETPGGNVQSNKQEEAPSS